MLSSYYNDHKRPITVLVRNTSDQTLEIREKDVVAQNDYDSGIRDENDSETERSKKSL